MTSCVADTVGSLVVGWVGFAGGASTVVVVTKPWPVQVPHGCWHASEAASLRHTVQYHAPKPDLVTPLVRPPVRQHREPHVLLSR